MNTEKVDFWKIFLGIIGSVALWFSTKACFLLYNDITLNAQAPVTEIQWSVKELSTDSFLLQAHYTFSTHGTTYSAEGVLQERPYLNAWAAQQAVSEYSKKQRIIWYNASNPAHSSLQKNFPFKECLSAVTLWGIFAYFIGLKYYITRLN